MCGAIAAVAAAGLLLLGAEGAGAATTPTAAVEFPGIKIFPHERRIEAEAAFLIVDSATFLEYLAVAPQGKTHESLLEIRCAPDKLHLGLLLLGLEPKPEVRFQGEAIELGGPRVAIEVEWAAAGAAAAGGRRRARVEDLLRDARMGATMPRTGFAFTGSRFIRSFLRDGPREIFAANASGSAIALYHDPDAVLDNPAVTGGDVPLLAPTFALPEIAGWVPGDERLRPETERLPPRGTAAVLHIAPVKE